MKLTTSAGTYEKYDLEKLNDNDIEKFWRIIQETWSFFFGEYVKCNCCGKVENKENIYGEFSNDFTQYTIEELEKKYLIDFKCNQDNCSGIREKIWGENFMGDLEISLTQNVKANLITFKNKANEIVGLGYSYVNTLQRIYEQDLYFDFSINQIEKSGLRDKMKQNFVIPTGLSIIEREKKFHTVMTMGKYMMITYPNQYNNLSGILASLNGSGTDRAYKKNGAFNTGIESQHNSDIQLLTQNFMIEEYKTRFSSILT